MYAYFAPKPGRAYAYSQNHTFIPMAGLAVAAYAVYGEVPEAAQWAALSRAIYSRVLETYSKDGYYYEGYEYWIFATPWLIHYLDAQKHATGEDLFDQPGLRLTHLYAAHALLPGGQSMFDFGDVFDGPITRAKQGEDYERSHPNGHFESNYNLLYDLAARVPLLRNSRRRRLDEVPRPHRPGAVVDARLARSFAGLAAHHRLDAVAPFPRSRRRLLALRLERRRHRRRLQMRPARRPPHARRGDEVPRLPHSNRATSTPTSPASSSSPTAST